MPASIPIDGLTCAALAVAVVLALCGPALLGLAARALGAPEQ